MNNDRVYYSHDAKTQVRREKAVLTVLALALGMGIGALLALLFAPFPAKKPGTKSPRAWERVGRMAARRLIRW